MLGVWNTIIKKNEIPYQSITGNYQHYLIWSFEIIRKLTTDESMVELL